MGWEGKGEERETYVHELLDLALLEARVELAGFGSCEAGDGAVMSVLG